MPLVLGTVHCASSPLQSPIPVRDCLHSQYADCTRANFRAGNLAGACEDDLQISKRIAHLNPGD